MARPHHHLAGYFIDSQGRWPLALYCHIYFPTPSIHTSVLRADYLDSFDSASIYLELLNWVGWPVVLDAIQRTLEQASIEFIGTPDHQPSIRLK